MSPPRSPLHIKEYQMKRISTISIGLLLASTASYADHFYTTDPKGELAKQAGMAYEGIAAHVYPVRVAGTTPMFRWFNKESGDHFYTTAANGEDALKAGHRAEGIGFYCYATPQANTVPLYRWFNATHAVHFYTTVADGELARKEDYKSEGIACHVHSKPEPGTTPLYRWYLRNYKGGASCNWVPSAPWQINFDCK